MRRNGFTAAWSPGLRVPERGGGFRAPDLCCPACPACASWGRVCCGACAGAATSLPRFFSLHGHHLAQRLINPRLVAPPLLLEPGQNVGVQAKRNRLLDGPVVS